MSKRVFFFALHRIWLLLLLAVCGDVWAQINHRPGATIAICSDSAIQPEWPTYYSAEGRPFQIKVTNATDKHQNCRKLNVPLAIKDIATVWPISREKASAVGNAIALLGSEDAGRFAISDLVLPEAPIQNVERKAMDGAQIPLPQIFGVEERAHWVGPKRLACQRGQKPAGAVIRFPPDSPRYAALRITIRSKSDGAFQIYASKISPSQSQDPLQLTSLAASATALTQTFAVPFTETGWDGLTFSCPFEQSWLEIESMLIEPYGPPEKSVGAWVWSPSDWKNRSEKIWALQSSLGLDRVYISVNYADQQVTDALQLSQFVKAAMGRKLAVWVVTGDPHDVLEEKHIALRNRLEALNQYNLGVKADAAIAGVQLDIEPWLLRGYTLAPGEWRDRYLNTVKLARRVLAAAMPLDLVLPVWMADDPDWGQQMLTPMAEWNISLTVMNYRTDKTLLEHGPVAFLEWGSRFKKNVRIALESGPIADETLRHYERTTGAGNLWLVQSGKQPLIVLTTHPVAGLPGVAFRQTRSTAVPGHRYSFAGMPERRVEALEELIPRWSAWPAFSGIALHGMDANSP